MIYSAERRIGLIGLTQSGKTTFLTSLLDHWSNHDPAKFPLGTSAKRDAIHLQWRDPDHERRFQRYRDALANGHWLDKTLNCSTFKLAISSQPWWRNQYRTIYDIPGERLADAEILHRKTIREWSDSIVHYMSMGDLKKLSVDFLSAYDRTASPSEAWANELTSHYREFIVRCLRSASPFITPSSVLVDAEGRYVPSEYLTGEKDIALWIREKSCFGLQNQLLIPLPKAFDGTEIYKQRQQGFASYREQVVGPALEMLASCQDIVVLIDVGAILTMGPEWKNHTMAFLQAIMRSVTPSGWWTKKGWDMAWYVSGGYVGAQAERVIFVATQADRVHADDRGKLLGLLHELVWSAIRDIVAKKRIIAEYCVVSAVESTESRENHTLTYRDIDSSAASSCAVTPLPDGFADDWKGEDFVFPITAPRVPVSRAKPPRQFGLEAITEKLLFIN